MSRTKYKSQEDYNKEQRIRDYEDMTRSPLVSELYSNIQEVHIRYRRKHESAFGLNNDSEWIERIFNSFDRAYFVISCMSQTCINGGYDLRGQISSLVNRKISAGKEKIICQGWEDADRVNQFHCLSELECEILIHYKDQTDS